MKLSIKFLNLNAKKIGDLGCSDCYQTHFFEVWQNILYGTYYIREVYYAADDEGYDKISKIPKEDAKEIISNNEFSKIDDITDGLKSFLVENWNRCRDYAKEFFADDLIQAAEYLYNQI